MSEPIVIESAPVAEATAELPQLTEEAADAWAAVLIDLYEKRKRREAGQRSAEEPDHHGDLAHAAGRVRSGR
jgi:hypothetical protein